MNAARWQEIKTAFDALLEIDPSLRPFEIGKIGARDQELGHALESLLAAHDDERDEFLQIPAAALEPVDDGPSQDSRLGTHIGPYELVRELGSGGMGEVYLARRVDSEFEHQVAIKLVRSGQDSAAVVRRFRAERQILADLDHPNIAKLLDGGRTAQGQPYFVMEYVAGLPITEYCDLHRLKIRERIELFLQACEGVQHAHQNAIIHRDLKPANILVIEVDGKAVPRIIDFGIAKAENLNLTDQTQLTRFGYFLGTPGYMSPEQADPNAKTIDSRTDVYSLGVILYVLLTGLQPFETAERQMPPLDVWLRQLRNEDPPRPSVKVTDNRDTATAASAARSTALGQLVTELRGDLDWIAMNALERNRDRRYATPLELAADLRRYLNDEPVTARPVSTGYQIRKFVRRHRFATAFIAMVTILSVVASGAALIALKQKREAVLQRSEAEHQAAETLKAQARSLTQAAAQRLKNNDLAGAQGIILAVLTGSEFAQSHTPAAISVFQEIRASDAQIAVRSGHGDLVSSARYSPDGTRIVTGSYDKTARIWDARTGAQLMVLSGHGDRIRSAAYSPDGTRIVTAGLGKTARIWDARTGAELAVLSGHASWVMSTAYSPDGTRVVSGSADKTARIWDARTGAELTVLSGHGDRIRSAAYAPDGTRIVTASTDRTARIWDARTGAELAVLSGHGDSLESAAYSPDGTRIVTASTDKTARIWDSRTGSELTVLSGYGNSIDSAAYSPDGTRIVTASEDKTARIWDARTGAELAALSGHGDLLESAAYSRDGTRIVTSSMDKTARIWDADKGTQLAVLSGHGDSVASAAYSPDGTRIVTASHDKTARIWDARTGAELTMLSGHAGFVTSGAYSPDGTRIVTASDDKTARIWDARTGAQLAVFSGHAGGLNWTAYSPDGTRIVTASGDKTARIWDARSGAQLVVLSGHGDMVDWAAYSPDGTRIVTASDDKTARIWDARTGVQLAVLSGHGAVVLSAAYSPDGTRIVTASGDKTARIWDAHIPAPIAAQILWDKVAETDPLPEVDRIELGLPPDARVRQWATEGSACDQAAGAFYDPDRMTRGLAQAAIVADVANSACSRQGAPSAEAPRVAYQSARALLAKSDVKGARQQLELAVSAGYRAAKVDLAKLLLDASAGMLDPARAVVLAQNAWQDGVPIAAYVLGHFYEAGVTGSPPDLAKAWEWYQKGSDAREPHALARLAERTERQALAESDPQKMAGRLLHAFSDYAAAAERAHDEDWPDEVWRSWRHRRATLARILARQGMMQQVSDAYAEVLSRSRQ
jgi:WD40 repeat protein/serine/threonine protein kinase